MDELGARRILGLGESCGIEEVKEAYRRLSRQYHPEEHPEEFSRIQQAYRLLMKRDRRKDTGYATFAQTEEDSLFSPMEEETELFQRVEKKALEQEISQHIEEKETDELRGIVKFRAAMKNEERMLYLLEKYPLSQRQYTTLLTRLMERNETRGYKKLIRFIRVRRGARPMGGKGRGVFYGVMCLYAVLGFVLGDACRFSFLGCIIALLYPELRGMVSPYACDLFLAFVLFFNSVFFIVADQEFANYLGVGILFAALVFGAVTIVRGTIALIVNYRKGTETSIE